MGTIEEMVRAWRPGYEEREKMKRGKGLIVHIEQKIQELEEDVSATGVVIAGYREQIETINEDGRQSPFHRHLDAFDEKMLAFEKELIASDESLPWEKDMDNFPSILPIDQIDDIEEEVEFGLPPRTRKVDYAHIDFKLEPTGIAEDEDWHRPQARIGKPCPIIGRKFPKTFRNKNLNLGKSQISAVYESLTKVAAGIRAITRETNLRWQKKDLTRDQVEDHLSDLVKRGHAELVDEDFYKKKSRVGRAENSFRTKSIDKMWTEVIHSESGVFPTKFEMDGLGKTVIAECFCHLWYDGYLICVEIKGGYEWHRRYKEKPTRHIPFDPQES